MPWKPARFKGSTIWAQVDDSGRPLVEGGRIAIRYNEQAGTKIYRAAVSGVMLMDAPPQALPDGVSADAEKQSGGGGGRASGFGKAGTRSAAQADAARAAAADLIASFHRDAVVAFTDGACRGNPGPAGAGAVLKLPDGRVLERHSALGQATNNVGELAAIGLAIDLLDEAGVSSDSPIEILTDSKYAHGQLSLGWKINANRELVLSLRKRLRDFSRLRLHWVAGHVGIPENERADALANLGVTKSAQAR